MTRCYDQVDVSTQYAEGISLGYLYANADREEHAALGTLALTLRAEAIEARGDSPSWRAFKLGIVRGYRSATRTLRNGRWGT